MTNFDAEYSYLQHDGGTTHYQVDGLPAAPLVVLVSGATLPLPVWDPLMAPLAASGFRVLRFDLSGRGRSSTLSVEPGLPSDFAQIESLLDALKCSGPVHLVGLASGAISISAFAEAKIRPVASLSLIAPDGISTLSLKERLFVAPLIGEIVMATIAGRIMLKRVLQYSRNPAVQDFLCGLTAHALTGEWYRSAVLAYARAMPLDQGLSHYQRAARLGTPLRVICGADDQINPIEMMTALRAELPSKDFIALTNVGHIPHAEVAEEVAASLAQHFRANDGQRYPSRERSANV